MRITLKITLGKPTKEDLHKIIDMICEGFRQGINQPNGINWELETNTTGYNYVQKLVDK